MHNIHMARKKTYGEPMVQIGIAIPLSLKQFLEDTKTNYSQKVREALIEYQKNSYWCERCKCWTVNSTECSMCRIQNIKEIKKEINDKIDKLLYETQNEELTKEVLNLKKFYEKNYVNDGEW